MNANITLGQYFPGNSSIHRLDPRTKILLMLGYIVMVFLVHDIVLFLLPLAFVVLVILLSRVPAGYVLRSLKPLRWLLIFMFLMNLFLTAGSDVLWAWKFLRVTREALQQAVYITIRLVLLVGGTSLMTLTTSPVALTDGLERLLKPFSKIGFPAHELAMMMTIALRFIPTLMEEADKIRKAQLSRGADFESGNLVRRAKSLIPILVPLFVSAFRRADELAMAMESRCYHGGEGRTRMHVLRYGRADAFAFGLTVLLCGAIVAAQAL